MTRHIDASKIEAIRAALRARDRRYQHASFAQVIERANIATAETKRAAAERTPLHPAAYELSDDGMYAGFVSYVIVPQEDGEWPPFAVVQATSLYPRDPRLTQETNVSMQSLRAFTPTIYQAPTNGRGETMKYCACCGEWVSRSGFSPDRRNRDGLQSWCKSCRANRERERYRQGAAA